MAGAAEALRERMATIQDLANMSSLLSWDQLTMMPDRGARDRSAQKKTIEIITHAMLTGDQTGRLLDDAESENASPAPDDVIAALIRVTRYDRDRALRVPAELVGQIAEAAADGYGVWTQARKTSDFASFLPALERNIELRFRYIECFEPEESPYDVLIEDFEQGLTSAEISTIFEGLKPHLQSLVRQVVEHGDPVDDGIFKQPFPIQDQQAVGVRVLQALGYDPLSWRIDATVHPFAASMGLSDIRLTTRYDENNLTDSLMSTIHEFGHGLYESQIDPNLRRTPLASGCSMILHESQSRFWENMVGKSKPFWTWVQPMLADAFPQQLNGAGGDQLYRAVNRMGPSLIRTEADELTYGYHIILRYELERDLIEGRLLARDLPEAWNAKMKEYLGIDVPSDRVGVLQDVHWSAGSIGYFPTYLLGSVLSAQIWDRMAQDLPDALERIGAGDFAPIREWQRAHVHAMGRMYTPSETIARAVGGPLDPGPYIAYMQAKVRRCMAMHKER